MFVETPWRSVVKAVSYRALGTLTTAVIVFFFVGRLDIAAGIGALDALAKIALYFAHERAWNLSLFGRREIKPAVIWFTGLSGSGKSTVSKRVFEEIRSRGLKAEYLDGDKIRNLFPSTGFGKADRDMHIRRVGHLASYLEKNGVFVVASFISPYAETRAFVRGLCGNFVEVYVSTPLEVCEKRDTKGLYAKARRGEIEHFTGVSDPYEPPSRPELSLDTSALAEADSARLVIGYLDRRVLGG